MSDSPIIEALKQDSFRIGNLQAIEYDRKRRDVFGDHYLYHLYQQCLLSRPNSPYGILDQTFCGMTDLSADAICAYLAGKQIVLLCLHDSPTQFTPVGFAWPTEIIRSPAANSAFCGFAMFRRIWGTPECRVLGMLGIAYLFSRHSLTCILGQRYAFNELAAKWMAQYGAVDCGTVPYLLRTPSGELVPCTASRLLRTDFEQCARRHILALAAGGIEHRHGREGYSRAKL